MIKTQSKADNKGKIKVLPTVLAVISLFYLIYVISLGNTKMIGDEIGGDPGGMILPLFIAIFMLSGFSYLAITERSKSKAEKSKSETITFYLTVLIAILYVALHSVLGFVLSSSLVLYTLTVLYLSIGKEKLKVWIHAVGLVSAEAATVLVYTAFRLMTRNFLKLGRVGKLPSIFGNSNFTAFLSLIVLLISSLILIFTVGKVSKDKSWRRLYTSGLISIISTLFLYIVFRQFFLVTLVPGIITW